MSTHKPLPTEFAKNGFTFTQLQRRGDVALFEQRKGKIIAFEIVRVQRHNGRTLPGGVVVGPAEFYPSSESWGKEGWTETTMEKAVERFGVVCSKEEGAL